MRSGHTNQYMLVFIYHSVSEDTAFAIQILCSSSVKSQVTFRHAGRHPFTIRRLLDIFALLVLNCTAQMRTAAQLRPTSWTEDRTHAFYRALQYTIIKSVKLVNAKEFRSLLVLSNT